MIAQTIQSQLLQTVKQNVLWSWGQTALQRMSESQLLTLGIKGEGALKFKVNAHHHQNHILVVLNFSDTYDVYICNIRGEKIVIKNEARGLYNDTFGDWIDKEIECIESYAS